MCLFFCCRDESAEHFSHAKYSSAQLIEKGTSLYDKQYDAVLEELKLVRTSSRHFTESQKLIVTIENGRTKIRTPLALAPKTGSRPAALEAQLQACARLAQLAGEDGGVPRALAALEECRKQAEKMELQFSHADEDGGHL
jgi:hypothetical protein